MPITVDHQRKYRFSAKVTTESGSYDLDLDGFTFGSRRGEPITRYNQALGPISLVGPLSYGECTMKFTLKVTDTDPNVYAQLITDLEALASSDYDTFSLSVFQKNMVGGSEEISYQTNYHFCRVVETKVDDLDSRGDDDLVHMTVSFIPGKADRLSGAQMA